MLLAIVGWVLIGLVIGFIATKFVNLNGDEPLIGIGVAVLGAAIGGALYLWLGEAGAWSLWGVACAVGGAVAAVGVYHAIRSRTISRDVQSVRRSY